MTRREFARHVSAILQRGGNAIERA
jgi:hypothetical protein